MSRAITNGIQVEVETSYLADKSSPASRRFAFAYVVTISNQGAETVQLRTRHWIITDGKGKVEEVRGPGVVGQQPVLKPGESHRYTSGCVLETPTGTMYGTYQMYRDDGSMFDAEIAPFRLVAPAADKQPRFLN
jgi:ApaG protein